MNHITLEQRYTIQTSLETGLSKPEIAEKIGKSTRTVYKEISRNCDNRNGKYDASLADRKAKERKQNKPTHVSFTQEIAWRVNVLLEEKYSPEQITATLNKEVIEVSHERIYQYIWADKKQGGDLYKNLRRKGKKYRNRGSNRDSRGIIKGRVSIEERPEIIDKKERVGDYEIDTIIGKDHKGAILTINERKTGMVHISLLNGKNAVELADRTIEILTPYKEMVFSITADNGKEFSEHKKISQALDIDFYFCHPYHSWERGSNENLNGLIRQYFPKGSSFENLTEKDVKFVENKLNNRPRKRYDFKSPFQVYNQACELC